VRAEIGSLECRRYVRVIISTVGHGAVQRRPFWQSSNLGFDPHDRFVDAGLEFGHLHGVENRAIIRGAVVYERLDQGG